MDQNCACYDNQKLPLTYNGANDVSTFFDWILAKLAGIQDRGRISDEFKFQPDWIIHFSVTRPWALQYILTDYDNGKMMYPR